jgi:hypothetical protein
MIAIDATEVRTGSTMPSIKEAIVVSDLEKICGADVLISRIDDLSCSKLALIKEHLAEGACLLQLKRGPDLAASIGDRRLNLSLCRMKQITANSHQRWLVTTGILTNKDGDDTAYFDGRALSEWAPGLAHIGYRSCQTAIRHWQMRGGRWLHVARLSDLPQALHDFERDLIAMHNKPVLDMYPDAPTLDEDSDDPFQVMKQIKDWRVMIVASKTGIGPELVNELYKRAGGSGGWALDELTDPDPKRERAKGLSMARVSNFRQRLHLKDDEMITVEKVEVKRGK